jgi:hypothetical protein
MLDLVARPTQGPTVSNMVIMVLAFLFCMLGISIYQRWSPRISTTIVLSSHYITDPIHGRVKDITSGPYEKMPLDLIAGKDRIVAFINLVAECIQCGQQPKTIHVQRIFSIDFPEVRAHQR